MNFEDIVDMDWVDSHTDSSTSEFSSSDFYFDNQSEYLLNGTQDTMVEIKQEPLFIMPSTDQIKQLIEIAKRQLALREQHATMYNNTTQNTLEMATAAPSTIFAPPPPASQDVVENILTMDDNRSDDTIKMESDPVIMAVSDVVNPVSDMSTNTLESPMTSHHNRRDSITSISPEESISLEAYAAADGIDLKKLTPKERRQLRNKISARNFRVRRKEYISTLEGQVNDHKMAAEALQEKLNKVEDENKKLRKEMDSLKRQNQLLLQQQQKGPSSPRISSLSKPNLNKDISMLGTKATDSYRQDNYILVSNAVMPVWDYNAILNQQKTVEIPEYISRFAGQFLLSVVQLGSIMPLKEESNQKEEGMPLMPDDRDFSSNQYGLKSDHHSSHLSMEDLYDTLIQSALISNVKNGSTVDKSFWWWDNYSSQMM
ncbi:hypothetical protein BDB01DRAFT_848863 [Pilobolus umbonatus]|nr:hypothetical protein BDB01DRAFT_848863 [Pilobolus umbonatus]